MELREPLPRGGPQQIPRPASVERGDDPPWAHLIGSTPRLRIDDVRSVFSGRTIESAVDAMPPGPRRSAVAVVMSPDGSDGMEILLTRRSWDMRTHRGEVSFPGGLVEPADDFPVSTALREAHEEVALDGRLVEIVGALDPLSTVTSDGAIVPVVGVCGSRPAVRRSEAEVDAVLHVAVSDLLHPECYRNERWTWVGGRGVAPRSGHEMHFFELIGDTVWGATAAMLAQLLTLLLVPNR